MRSPGSTKRRSSKDDTLPDLETDDDRKCRRLMDNFRLNKIVPSNKRNSESWKSIQVDQLFRDQARIESSRPTMSYHEQVSERGIYRNRGYDWDLNRLDDVEPEFRLDYVTRGPTKPYLTTIINDRGITVHRLYNPEALDQGSCQVITQWAFDNIISGRPIQDYVTQPGRLFHHEGPQEYGFRRQRQHYNLNQQVSAMERIIQHDANHREMRDFQRGQPQHQPSRRGSRYTWYRTDQDRRHRRNNDRYQDDYEYRNQRK